ncbi:cyclin-d3-1 [Phtheirospermum japonicum]|uniref:Cyclin-d3-1 n=1 Tax=Phtheirospermum japonicum TaxID=374723 RepID=A0A830AWP8_9LAMI|nr:cyclin-d3-1 [Phtheirospermum japonicum]
MVFSHFQAPQQKQPLLQNPIFDALYCDEERFDDDLCSKEPSIEDFDQIHPKKPLLGFLFEHDLFWEDDEILTLLSKEKAQTRLCYDDLMNSDGFLKTMRSEAVKWMLRVIGRYGFTAMTAVLAVNYYDRFIKGFCFQREKPWMGQLAAVACLSIAAKVEETHVPLLLDFQVEDCKYMFESKTIQRMELLVLSALQWKMNPVTPISLVDHIVRRFELITNNPHWDFVKNYCRFVHYLPSVIAAAVMKYVIKEIEPCDEYQNRITSALRISEEKMADCYELITEIIDGHGRNLCRKRKHAPTPGSPSGVIDAYFSSDSSNDSWAVGSSSSSSSSPEPLSKRFAPLSTVCWRG